MTEPIYDYDPAQALHGLEAIEAFLADALDTGDAAYIAKAMDVATRARAMTALATKTQTNTLSNANMEKQPGEL